jgi:hypothetical protein
MNVKASAPKMFLKRLPVSYIDFLPASQFAD